MVFDQAFFVAVSFVIFVALVYKPVGGIIAKILDQRADKIKNELGEALRLKEEAQSLLASYQRRQKEVVEEAELIVKEAEAEAKRISQEAEKELEVALNKRVEVAMQKIASYESAVIQEVKNHAVDIAISTIRSLVVDNLNKEMAEELVSQSIADMGKKLN